MPPDLDLLDPLALVSLLHRHDAEAIRAVDEALPAIAEAIRRARERFAAGGCIHYFGAGTSGRLAALDAAECPPTFGTEPERVQAHLAGGTGALVRAVEGAEDDADLGARDAECLASGDIAVGIAASGRTPYVVGALTRAREIGALTVAIACVRGSAIGHLAEVAIEAETGPEALEGSTRLKAGTAQKAILNMLSTGIMAGVGRVYGNRMVDVRATNDKLRARAIGIVRDLARVAPERAEECLRSCGWDVRLACVAAARSLAPEEARRVLEAHRGSLRGLLPE